MNYQEKSRKNELCYCFFSKHAVFSRITLVSCFCAENELSGKMPENMPKIIFHQKIHGARRRDGEEAWGAHPCQAQAHHWPRLGGAGTLGTPSGSLCAYKLPFDLKTEGGSIVFQKEFRSAAATRNQDSDPETPFWHPAGTENLERIIAIVITNESPSTTDVSLVHE